MYKEETWKDVKGYEGLYQVSDMGNVKRVQHEDYNCRQGYRIFKERLLKQEINFRGYMKVTLSKNNIHKGLFVHRLVAEAFILNPNNYPQVNHKDENKANNCVDNLEWCDNKYNNNYGTKPQRLSAIVKEYHRKKRQMQTESLAEGSKE